MRQPSDLPDESTPRPYDAGAASEEPAADTMPAYLTPLIGRDDDQASVRASLIERGHRMVVITGSGGIGKTRLAVEIAGDLQDHYLHGARFLSLASVPPQADLDAAFAWHLGLRDVQHQSYRESIRQHLQFREQLLVVDNVEHLPDIAELLLFIQRTALAVSLIVTSRTPLGLYGEVVHRLEPLQVRPASSLLPGAAPWAPGESPAVLLFTERVRSVVPDFTVTPENVGDVVAICDHLGGIPLALEIIAPRLGTNSPASLLADLQQNVDAAATPETQAAQGPMSMRDIMRLSYEQLDDNEQLAFRSLSVMRGHWTIDDVLPILTPDIDEMDAITSIDSLVTRSLLYSPSGRDDDVRFAINPVLRQFGRTMLEQYGALEEIAERHAARMIALSQQAEPHLTGSHQREWLARIDALHEDFHYAHRHLRARGRATDALMLSTGLWRYAYIRGHYREVRRWIESSLDDVPDHEELKSRALNGVGLLAAVTGDIEGSRAAHVSALELASQAGIDREIALSRIGLAGVEAVSGGDPQVALRHLEIAAATYERLQDPRGLAGVLTNQGNIQWEAGDLDRAYTTHEEARVLYAQASDARGVAWSDTNTGRIAAQQRRYHDAVPRLLAALDGYIEIRDAHGLTEILEALAGVASGLGDLETAALLAGSAITMREALGSPLQSPDLEEFEHTLTAIREWPEHPDALARGAELSPEEAIEIARSIGTPDAPLRSDGPDTRTIAHERYGITPREYQVLLLLGEGLTDHEIGERLQLSRRTVQTYSMSIAQKLGATTRVSVVRAAHQAGILPRVHDQQPD
jgi:predicted ATPase/DNA-binding CsgD family transcriptional regulator